MQSPLWAVGATITVFNGAVVVGSIAVFWDEAENRRRGCGIGSTEYIFVRPEWRGHGIARRLICEGLVYLQEHGLVEASLEVRASNLNALKLYEGLGYRVMHESKLYALTL